MSPNFLRISHTGTLPPMKLPEWITGSQRRVDDAERQRVLGMGVNHRYHVRPRLEDRRMNETLEIGLPLVADRLALLIELDQIVPLDQFRRTRARQEEALRIVGVAHTDMAVGVDHVFMGEDAVGDNEIAQEIVELAHVGGPM